MQPLPPEKHEEAEIAAGFLSAMANPKRLLILDSLVKEEMAVGTLANKVGLSQSALSQHLSKLRAQNLVSTRRDAQTIYYSSSSDAVLKILGALSEIYGEQTNAVEEKASHSQIGVISQDLRRPAAMPD
ncbi:ArsR/SmtB family transcription factor [Sinorhizobium medicae]|nr:metalloregulator ArsR/SmtB family transcription factor [Sinorhizobium medicae]WQO44621.1 metalloregulator ArsR/SmtB family transcription factor [Sinorhizobium medicae]